MASRTLPFLLALAVTAGAQAATTLDTGFRPVFAAPATVKAVAVAPDGKVVVGGDFTTMNGQAAGRVARLNADGSLDTGFTVSPEVDIVEVMAVAVQADGKVLIGGQMTRFGTSSSQSYLFRLNADGSRDATFDAGGYVYGTGTTYGLDGPVRAIAVDASQRIVVGGTFLAPQHYVARLNADGSADGTFNPGSGADNAVTHVALQSTGRIVIGGAFGAVNGVAKMNIARLESTGAVDPAAFGTGVAGGHLLALAIQPDDRVLAGGTFALADGVAADKMARFGADGAVEPGFAPAYVSGLQSVTSLAATATRIYIGGWYTFSFINGYPTDHAARVYMVESGNGAWVNMVAFEGKPTDTLALARRADGSVVAAGSFSYLQGGPDAGLAAGLALVHADQSPVISATWRPVAGGQADVLSLARQADGKLVAGGSFHLVNGTYRGSLARMNPDGSLDATLVPPTLEGGTVTGVIARADGRLVIGTNAYRIAGVDYRDVALLSATGAVEASAYAAGVRALAAYPGDRTLVATLYAPGVRRLDASFAVETAATFNPGGITNSQQPDLEFDRVNALAVQPDGRILVGGSFAAWGAEARQNIVRLNADGTTDPTFTSPAFTVATFRSEVFAIALQPDGKILVAGRFSTVGGLPRPTVARLNADGTVDASFLTPLFDQGLTAYAVQVEPAGTVLVGGSLQLLEGVDIYNGLVRFTATGARATTLATSVTGAVKVLLRAPATGGYQVYAGGAISAADGSPVHALGRYDDPVDPAADSDGDGMPDGVEISFGTNPYAKDNDIFSPGLGSGYLFAMQQYRDFLGREGDWAGVQGWAGAVAGGTYTRAQVIDAFLSSAEFGGFVAPVVRLYFATFLRVPDYAGLTYNAALVRAGTLTPAQLADFFAASPEFQATYGSLGNADFVTLLYTNVLGRAPDPAGLAGWTALLDGGMSRGQVLIGFSDSAEYAAAMANEVLVTMMYTGMLRRTPEPAGFGGWVSLLDTGARTRDQVIDGFFWSPEYRARFLP